MTLMMCILCFSSANKCLLKVATYAAQLERYPKAIEIYEQVKPIATLLLTYWKYNLFM